jgi:hypothetical protein
MGRTKCWSAEKSVKNVRQDAVTVARATNAAWGVATKAPLFLRRPKMVGTGKTKKRATMTRNGKEVPCPQKTNRAVRKSAWKTLLSAAALNAAETLGRESSHMNVPIQGEAAVAAAMPSMAKGAELALEHALVIYAQTIFDNAVRIRKSVQVTTKDDASSSLAPLHKKVTVGAMAAAAEITNSMVFGGSTLQPGMLIRDYAPKRKKKTKAKATEESTGA